MPQPYDYSLGVPSATESFLGGIQMAQKLRENKLQAEAAQAKLDAAARAKQYTADVAAIKNNPSPDALNELYLKYPEYGDDLKRITTVLTDQDKRTYGTILREAIIAKQRGASPDEIAAIYTKGEAAANTAGRDDIAKNFNQAAYMATNKAADDDFAARSLLNQFDPDGYKILYGSEGLTGFQQELAAAGIDPRSPEGRQKAKEYVELKTDPIVEMDTPTGGKFVGRQSEYYARYGKEAPKPQPTGTTPVKPRTFSNVTTLPTDLQPGDIVNGKRFIGGPTNEASSWEHPKGGQTGTPSGGFR